MCKHNLKQAVIKYTILSIISQSFINQGFCQQHTGFLKPAAPDTYVRDTEYLATRTKALLSPGTYFEILSADSSKFLIRAVCKTKCYGGLKPPCRESYTCYVDSSKIIQFDNLPDTAKRQRIDKAFDDFMTVLKIKPFSISKIEFTDETVYEPLREEFSKFWFKYRDEALLSKWFMLLYLDGGSADEMQDKFLGKLFCEDTDKFWEVLNRQSQKLKDYIVYRLHWGIYFYVVYTFKPDTTTEGRIQSFDALLESKLKSLRKEK